MNAVSAIVHLVSYRVCLARRLNRTASLTAAHACAGLCGLLDVISAVSSRTASAGFPRAGSLAVSGPCAAGGFILQPYAQHIVAGILDYKIVSQNHFRLICKHLRPVEFRYDTVGCIAIGHRSNHASRIFTVQLDVLDAQHITFVNFLIVRTNRGGQIIQNIQAVEIESAVILHCDSIVDMRLAAAVVLALAIGVSAACAGRTILESSVGLGDDQVVNHGLNGIAFHRGRDFVAGHAGAVLNLAGFFSSSRKGNRFGFTSFNSAQIPCKCSFVTVHRRAI